MPILIETKNIFAIISYPFLPATTGGEISTLNLLSFLGQVHRVKVFTVNPYRDVSKQKFNFEIEFGMRFSVIRYVNIFLLFTIIKKIKQHQSDYIFFDQPFMGWMIIFLRIFTGKKVFIRSNNIEYLRFKSMGKNWWPVMYMYEKFVYKSANLVIFVSDTERQKAIYEFDLTEHKTLLTPYGIPQESIPTRKQGATEFLRSTYNIPANHCILLFFATMSYSPNYEAAGFIADEIYPRLKQNMQDFTILICGKNLPDFITKKLENKPEMIYCGFVDDIDIYIDGCHAMINPILSGGGVKTKAIDTLGRGKTVVSTKTGAEGINQMVCGSKLIICEDYNWDDFVKKIIYAAQATLETIPQTFFNTYSWPKIINTLSNKLTSL